MRSGGIDEVTVLHFQPVQQEMPVAFAAELLEKGHALFFAPLVRSNAWAL